MINSDSSAVPKPEYPRPQFARADWLNLNGQWQFEIDPGDSGLERGIVGRELSDRIVVPFPPESEASGLGNTDYMDAVWYRREVQIPQSWQGKTTLLHFGAVDHDTTVWVDGAEVVRHRGGFSPFTAVLWGVSGSITVVVRARDDHQTIQARGKQSGGYANGGCHYTRTTGIWQTVWAEPVPAVRMGRPRITPHLADPGFTVEVPLTANPSGWKVRVGLSDHAGEIVAAEVAADLDRTPTLRLGIPADRVRLWQPGDGQLYDLTLELLDAAGQAVDSATSYAGLRSTGLLGRRFLINNEPVFQRLVLDQGYWPESLMTSPDDAALVRDIELSLAAGFNGARLHQKVFEERFLFHADRLGYLVWGEFGDWGCGGNGPSEDHQRPTASYITQWLEVLERDYSHPSIIGWCPVNETHQMLHDRITVLDDVTRGMFLATKASDRSRPVLDASGYSHRVLETEIYDSHNYEQQPAQFADQVGGVGRAEPYVNTDGQGRPISQPYAGQPYFVSEYGGIWWNPDAAEALSGRDNTESWGYGDRIADEEEFHARFAGLTEALLRDPEQFGYCYTQLTDVFQEQNGIYRFDRSTKLDVARVHAVQQQPAAYEQK
ncbi:MAG: glycoside hydrolase family 2 protein [Propionibacteriaceae bacterium]